MLRSALLIAVFLCLSLIQRQSYAQDDLLVVDSDTQHSAHTESQGEIIEPKPPKPVTEDPAITALIEWLTSQGANISDIEVVDTQRRGRGLIATKDLPANQTIVSLPFHLLITPQWIKHNSSISHLLSPNTHPTDAFAIYLASNRADKQSPSRAFIDSLPQFVPLPLFYSDYLMNELKNTTLEQTAQTRRGIAYRSYAKLNDAVKQHVSKGDYMWALSVAWSRSFGVAERDQATNQWKSVSSLAPLADFLNTGDEHELNVKCRTAKKGQTFECMTTRPVNKGDELLVSYGKRSNSQLLHDYGFSTFNPINDVALIKLPTPRFHRETTDGYEVLHRKGDVQDAMNRAGKAEESLILTLKTPAILNSTSFDPNQTLSVAIPDDTFGWARLCVIDKDDLSELETYEMIERMESGEMFSANNELRAVRLINHSIHEALSHFTTTIQQDLDALNGNELVNTNAALFWITLMRFFEKSVLVDVSALIEEKLPELQLEAVKESAARLSREKKAKQEAEERKARELARKAQRERLRREEQVAEFPEDEEEFEDDDEDEDDIAERIKSQAASSAAWRKREL